MAARQSMLRPAPARPELDRLVEEARKSGISEEQLQEQRVSFAYGNAPAKAERVTKEICRARFDEKQAVPA